MSAKIYLRLLFFCGILCQGIFATVSDKDSNSSSDFLVRKRRVINHLPGGRTTPRIEDVNYIVKIKQGNRANCAGAILSHRTVITAIACVNEDHYSRYQVHSGAAGNTPHNVHNVTSKIDNTGNRPHPVFDGISLITVDPPFIYSAKTGSIRLYTGLGPINENLYVTVYGWGYLYPVQPGPEVRQRLRSIVLQVMNHEQCRIAYYDRFEINEKHICTHHALQYCARGDTGAPLIVNGMLAGIHIWKGEFPGRMSPDVFINLQNPEFSHWIIQHIV